MLLLSTAYLPPVEYVYLLYCQGEAIIDLHETYRKQTWRNRSLILTGNGPLSISVPVEKPNGNHTITRDVLLSNHFNWRGNQWKTIVSAYRNAPYFIYYQELLSDAIFNESIHHLAELNFLLLCEILKESGIIASIGFSDCFIADKGDEFDFRFKLTPKANYRDLSFKTLFPPYYQVFKDRFGFQPNCSIADLLFNLGPDMTGYLDEMKQLNENNRG